MKKLLTFLITLLAATCFAQNNTFKVGLTWTPNTEPTVTKYRVYRGEASRQYNWSQDVALNTTTFVDGLEPGKTYFFAVTAWADFLESDKSNEVSYTTHTGEPTTAPTGVKVVRTLTYIQFTWDLPPTNQFVGRWHVSYAIRNKGPQLALVVTEPKAIIPTTDVSDVYEIFIVADGILGRSPAAYVEVPNIPPAPIGIEIVPGSLKVVYATPSVTQ